MSEVSAADGAARCEPWPATWQSTLVAVLLLLVLTALAAPAADAAPCTVARLPDIPVTMKGLVPMVHAQVNGTDGLFIAGSGAFFSFMTPAAVQEFHLKIDNSINGLYVQGIGGRERAQVARAATFTIFGKQWENVEFMVAGGSWASGGAVGLLGQNLFHIADVEYDLANGVIRLVEPRGDCKKAPLAYWASTADKPYSVIDLEFATAAAPRTKAFAYLNGERIQVAFDTGSSKSLLTLAAARRAGITPTSAGVSPAGDTWGIGDGVVKTWIARFASFKLGDEEIQHAQLRFGDIALQGADMVIGADFFLSHRIYVANSQRKLYFTYNGGAVFDLAATREKPVDAGAAPAAAAPPNAAERLDEPTDAAGFARRGAASAARHDYHAALADLNRACELAPTEASYFYERGLTYWQDKQADLALADFNQAIKLKPDDVDAIMARASVLAGRHQPAAAVVADLEAADRVVSRDDDLHLRIAALYEDVGEPGAAVLQLSKWIDSHPRDDLRMARALNSRCFSRALAGQELDRALADCNTALRMSPQAAEFLDSRGLVNLRLAKYDKAIADYDAALKLRPKAAWSLYGRGVARLREGQSAEGRADIDAATAVDPMITERATKLGITP